MSEFDIEGFGLGKLEILPVFVQPGEVCGTKQTVRMSREKFTLFETKKGTFAQSVLTLYMDNH